MAMQHVTLADVGADVGADVSDIVEKVCYDLYICCSKGYLPIFANSDL